MRTKCDTLKDAATDSSWRVDVGHPRDGLLEEPVDGASTHPSPLVSDNDDQARETAAATAVVEGMPTPPGDAVDGLCDSLEISSIFG